MTHRARHRRVADPHAGAAAAVGRERHALAGRRRFVDAARRSVSGFVDRGRDVAAVAQARAQLAGAHRRLKFPRRQADDRLEAPLQVMRAHRRDARQVIERHGLIGVRGEIRRGAAHGLDAGLRRGRRCRAGSACRRGIPPAAPRRSCRRSGRDRRAAAGSGNSAGNRRRSRSRRRRRCHPPLRRATASAFHRRSSPLVPAVPEVPRATVDVASCGLQSTPAPVFATRSADCGRNCGSMIRRVNAAAFLRSARRPGCR